MAVLAADRRDQLLVPLRDQGELVAEEVVADLGAAEDVIRRALPRPVWPVASPPRRSSAKLVVEMRGEVVMRLSAPMSDEVRCGLRIRRPVRFPGCPSGRGATTAPPPPPRSRDGAEGDG